MYNYMLVHLKFVHRFGVVSADSNNKSSGDGGGGVMSEEERQRLLKRKERFGEVTSKTIEKVTLNMIFILVLHHFCLTNCLPSGFKI